MKRSETRNDGALVVNALKQSHCRAAVSLTELVCCLAICSILMALYLGAIMRAYVRIMAFIETLR
jgi:hypothetical protein